MYFIISQRSCYMYINKLEYTHNLFNISLIVGNNYSKQINSLGGKSVIGELL